MPAVVTAAGVDTWSPSWYVDPEGAAARWLQEWATVPGARGSRLVPEQVGGYRLGWFPTGLVFAEGHPDPGRGLCPAGQLVTRALDLQEAIAEAGLPLPMRERPLDNLGATSEGFAGLRRADVTVNLDVDGRAEGLAVLAGIAACVRDAPGKAQVFFGPDRSVETVTLRGHAGKNVLGRWYDKGLESSSAARGRVLRGEDQRRWPKGFRRDPAELDAAALRGNFNRRFYPLYQATKGVTVAGLAVLAEKLGEAVESGDLTVRQAETLGGYLVIEQAGLQDGVPRATRNRRRRAIRELGLVLADGVLQEVEVDVGAVLEAAMETDLWERYG